MVKVICVSLPQPAVIEFSSCFLERLACTMSGRGMNVAIHKPVWALTGIRPVLQMR